MITLYLGNGEVYDDEDRYTITERDYGVVVHDSELQTNTTYPWHRVREVLDQYAK